MPVPDPLTSPPAVPHRFRGLWARTLRQTPQQRDDRTFVRWLQTSHWHADLRIPPDARPAPASTAAADGGPVLPERLALQQGFCGVTSVEARDGRAVCTWQHRADFQPPGPLPDAGWVSFESADRIIETGVHGSYTEVWDRVPGSTDRFAVLEAMPSVPGALCAWLLVAGRYAMRVRPRALPWPSDTRPADSLAHVARRHPEDWERLLDFEISFGRLEHGRWSILQSTCPELEGAELPCTVQRRSGDEALVRGPAGDTVWRILEWDVAGPALK